MTCKMKLKNKAVVFALIGVFFYCLVMKYPTYNHQYLPDSPDFHVFTNLLNTYGTPIWGLHILSYWGAYPFSEPMGIIFILSSISQLTSLHVESSMMIMNAGALLVGISSSFCLGKKIFKSPLAGLLIAFFFIHPGWQTIFIATPRAIAAMMFPLMFLIMLYAYERKDSRVRYLLLLILVIVVTFGIHRLTVFIILPILTFLIVVPFYPLLKRKIISPLIDPNKHRWSVNYWGIFKTLFVSGITFSVVLISFFFLNHLFEGTDFLFKTALFTGEDYHIQLINFFYFMARQTGPMVLFSLIGFILLIKKSNTSYEAFAYLGIIGLIPFSFRNAYIWNIWPFFMSLFAGYGVYTIGKTIFRKDRFKMIKIVALSLLLIMPFVLTTTITIEEPFRQHQPWVYTYMTDEEWEAGIYFGNYLEPDEAGFSPRGRNHGLAAISNRNHLRLGMHGIEMIWANRSFVDDLSIVYVGDTVLNESLDALILRKGVLFVIEEDPLFPERNRFYRDLHWIWLQQRYGREEYERIVDYYRLRIITLYKLYPSDMGREYERNFRQNIRNDAYKVYENSFYQSYNTP